MKRTCDDVAKTERNEELFLAGVEFLSKKYKIDDYNLITKNGYHVTADDLLDLEIKKELTKLFKK